MTMPRRLRVYLTDRRLLTLLLAIVLLALTLFDPDVVLQRAVYRYVFVFDITQSMNVSDVGEPDLTRLRFASRRIAEAITALPCGSGAGLALFSGHRTFLLFTPVEVCDHYAELTGMLAALDWRMAWEARSEVAKGLHQSIAILSELDDNIRLVFISDGHEAPPVNASFRPAFRGEPGAVKGLIAGVGGIHPMPIPKLDDNGRLLGYWQPHEVMQVDSYSLGRGGASGDGEAMAGVDSGDLAQRIRTGSEHLSSLRETYLQQLAHETGLHYHRLHDGAALAAALSAPDLAHYEAAATDIRWLPAALALLLLLSLYLPRPKLRLSGGKP
jgi:mxaL protein